MLVVMMLQPSLERALESGLGGRFSASSPSLDRSVLLLILGFMVCILTAGSMSC